MDDDLRARLVRYINSMEDSICGELHGHNWPACDDNRTDGSGHAEGRALLAVLGGVAERLPISA